MLGAYIQEKWGRKAIVTGNREHWTHGYYLQKIHTLWISYGKSKMKFETGQIVKYELEKEAWMFIVVGIHPNLTMAPSPYYSLYCIKSPNNQIQRSDLHATITMSEDLLSAV